MEALRQTLEEVELSRAERFAFQKHRRAFIAAHGVLRSILARYLSMEPARLRFSCGPQGKPLLSAECRAEDLRFNMSHSGALALYAVSRGLEVGVDVERIAADVDWEQIVDRLFSPAEVSAIRALPQGGQREAFFSCWTRKEACIKAAGGGLSIPLDRLEVFPEPSGPDNPRRVRLAQDKTTDWCVASLLPGRGYVGALAAEGYGWQVKCWQWSEDWAAGVRAPK